MLFDERCVSHVSSGICSGTRLCFELLSFFHLCLSFLVPQLRTRSRSRLRAPSNRSSRCLGLCQRACSWRRQGHCGKWPPMVCNSAVAARVTQYTDYRAHVMLRYISFHFSNCCCFIALTPQVRTSSRSLLLAPSGRSSSCSGLRRLACRRRRQRH